MSQNEYMYTVKTEKSALIMGTNGAFNRNASIKILNAEFWVCTLQFSDSLYFIKQQTQ